MERPLISVVTPAHNEEAALAQTIERVAKSLCEYTNEIIIVDDGSTDTTWRTIQSLKDRFPEIRAIRFTRNFGHQSAILAGLIAAQGEAVIMMDSDGQHPAEMIPAFIKRWQEGFVIVQGVRVGKGDESILKRWSSRLFYGVLSLLSGVDVPKGSADFRLLGRSGVDIVLRSTGPLLFLRGLIPWLGFEISYVPFEPHPRTAGRPSFTWRRMIHLSIEGLMSFSIIPLRLSIALGISVSALSFLYLIYIVFIWLTSSRVVPGWASMTGLLSLLGGIQLLTIGVLGEYLGRLFVSNLNRPHFVIREQL
jgi:dolichol-phosphate mannosyltransferase